MRQLVFFIFIFELCAILPRARAANPVTPQIPQSHAHSYQLNSRHGYSPVDEKDRLQEVWVFDMPTTSIQFRQSTHLPANERYESKAQAPVYVLPGKTPRLATALAKAGFVRRQGTQIFAAKETSHDTWMVWDNEQQRVLFKIKFQISHQTSNSWSTTVMINDLIEDILDDPKRHSYVGYYPERTGVHFEFEVDGKKFVHSYTLRESDVRYMRAFDNLNPVLDIPLFALPGLLASEKGHLFAAAAQEVLNLFPGGLAGLSYEDGLYPMAHNQNFHVLIGIYPDATEQGEPRYGLMGFGFQDTFDTAFDPIERMMIGHDPRLADFKEWVSIMDLHHSYHPRHREYANFHQGFTTQIVENFLEIAKRINSNTPEETINHFFTAYSLARQNVLLSHGIQRAPDEAPIENEISDAINPFLRTPQYSAKQWNTYLDNQTRLREITKNVLAEGKRDHPRIFFHNHNFTRLSKAQLLENGFFTYRNGLVQIYLFEPNLLAVATYVVNQNVRSELDAKFGTIESPTYLNHDLAARNMIRYNLEYSTDIDSMSEVFADTIAAQKLVNEHAEGGRRFYHLIAEARAKIIDRLIHLGQAATKDSKPRKRLFGKLAREQVLSKLPKKLYDHLIELLLDHPETLHPSVILQLLMYRQNGRSMEQMISDEMPDARSRLDRIYKSFATNFGRHSQYELIGDPTGVVHLAEWGLQHVYFDVLTKKRNLSGLDAFLRPLLEWKVGKARSRDPDTIKHYSELWERYVAHINNTYPPTRKKWTLRQMKEAQSNFTKRILQKSCQALAAKASAPARVP